MFGSASSPSSASAGPSGAAAPAVPTLTDGGAGLCGHYRADWIELRTVFVRNDGAQTLTMAWERGAGGS